MGQAAGTEREDMQSKDSDIDQATEVLDYLWANPDDAAAAARFCSGQAQEVIRLLEELRAWREREREEAQGRSRIVVEGYSEESEKAAFSQALAKAMKFFSQDHDTHVSVVGLMSLPHGGHRATLEVLICPLTHNLTSHPEAADVELKHIHDREHRKEKRYEENHLKELVHEHFIETTGAAPHVPDFFMINITDAELMNKMIEKDFFNAVHEPEAPRPQGPITVQVRRPEPRPEGTSD